jgi:hypothetical protein
MLVQSTPACVIHRLPYWMNSSRGRGEGNR